MNTSSPAIIRGQIIEEDLISYGGREDGADFIAPDAAKIVSKLPLGSPAGLSDLYELTLDEILDYLHELCGRLQLKTNPYMQEALEANVITNACTRPVLESAYITLPAVFSRPFVEEVCEQRVGMKYLEGWADTQLADGRTLSLRAFGARTLHIIAGNAPIIAALTVMRNAVTRSDGIIKLPSNDPYTALGIIRTMIEMAPDHPVTKHISAAYWKGGNEEVEQRLYQPSSIEKIVAWGGLASVKHVTKYIQPGLELITMDPKRSVSVIGPEALENDQTMTEVANRLAADMGAFNQEGCVNTRVVYVVCGTDDEEIERLNELGQRIYDQLMTMPEALTTKPKHFNQDLKANILSAALQDDWFKVIGGEDDEGAVIVSQMSEKVDFAASLANRVINLVPLDDADEVYNEVDAYTQTVGVYPEPLKVYLRDKMSLFGAQRFVSLGYSANGTLAAPQDAVEPMRRMCKWIVDESCDPGVTPPLWRDGVMLSSFVE